MFRLKTATSVIFFLQCVLVARVLSQAQGLSVKTCRNGLTIVLAAHIVILGFQVVVNLGEKRLLV